MEFLIPFCLGLVVGAGAVAYTTGRMYAKLLRILDNASVAP